MNRRAHRAVALVTTAIFITLLVPSAATGLTYAYVRGHVYDMKGNPLHLAYVSTTTSETWTQADGSYELAINGGPGCWPVTASSYVPQGAYFESYTRYVCVWLSDAEGEDFRVPYYIYGTASPVFLTSLEDRAVTQTALIYCPPEFCSPQVHVYRLPLGQDPYGEGEFFGTFLLQFDHTDEDGYSHYKTDIPIPAGTPEGQYRVVRESRNPETGELQTRCMFDRCWNWFVIDNTAPRLGPGSPETWANTAEPLIRIPFEDEYPVGIDTASLIINLDGRQLERSEYSFDGIAWDGELLHQAAELSNGNHSVSLTLTDRAGNPASIDFSFVIDTLTPGASDASPTGIITTPSPTISARVTDGDSAETIDPSSIGLFISNGVLTNELEAVFDAESGIVSYDVPQRVEGLGIGDFPLLDGEYTVSLHFGDFAGNAGYVSWQFTVHYWLT